MQYATQPSAWGMSLAGASRAGGKRKGAARDRATRPSVVITELPYQTNKANFVAAIADLVEEQKLTGVPPCCAARQTLPLLCDVNSTATTGHAAASRRRCDTHGCAVHRRHTLACTGKGYGILGSNAQARQLLAVSGCGAQGRYSALCTAGKERVPPVRRRHIGRAG